jgi:hypothetical protein
MENFRNNWDTQIQKIVSIISKMPYGTEVKYEQLEKLIHVDRHDMAFQYIMSRVRFDLIEIGVMIKTIQNVGYKILHPREVASEVLKRYGNSALEKLTIGKRILKHTDTTVLSMKELHELEICENLFDDLLEDSSQKIKDTQVMLYNIKRKELGE